MSGSRGARIDKRYPYGRGIRVCDVLDKSILRKLPHIPPIPECPIDRDKYKNHKLLDMAKKYKEEERKKASCRWKKSNTSSNSKTSRPTSAKDCTQASKLPLRPNLPKSWERNIVKKVSPNSSKNEKWKSDFISNMMIEVRSEYVACMNELELIQSVKPDPKEDKKKSEEVLKLEKLLSLVTPELRHNRKYAISALKFKLQIFHPCVQSIFQNCLKNLRTNTIDLSSISFPNPVSTRQLEDTFDQACEAMEYKILNRWWQPVYKELVDLWESKNSKTIRVKKIVLQTSAVLISLELRNAKEIMIRALINQTMAASTCNYNETKLRVDIKLLGREVAYTPSEEHIVQTWLSLVRRLDNSLTNIFKHLGKIDSIRGAPLKMHPDVLNKIEFEITAVISCQKENLEEWANNFVKDFLFVVYGDAEEKVAQFLKTANSFPIMEEELLKNQAILKRLSEKPNGEHFLILYADVTQLKRGLREILEHIVRQILDTMYQYHVKHNTKLCEEFYDLKSKLQNVPRNTEEMLKMNVLLDHICSKKLPELSLEVQESGQRMLRMLDNYQFLPADLELNSEVLSLPTNIEPNLETCTQMLDSSKWNLEDNMAAQIDFVTKEVDRLSKQVKDFDGYGDINLLRQYTMESKLFHKRVLKVFSAISWINHEEHLFKIPVSSYPDADSVSQELSPYLQLYSAINNWQRTEKNWLDGSFLDMKSDQIESQVELFSEQAYELQKTFRGKFKNVLTGGGNRRALNSNKTQNKPVSIANLPPPLKLCEFLSTGIAKFKGNLAAIGILCNPGLKTRHWHEMAQELEVGDIVPNTGTTLRRMLELPISFHLEKLETIAAVASKEYSLEQALVKMKQEWDQMSIPLLVYRDGETRILASIEEIQNLLDDHVVRTQTMRGSPFSKPIEKNIKSWETKLNLLQDTLDAWLSVQSQWLYLEPVFSSQDIMIQIPIEGKLFVEIDQKWREAMHETTQSPKVLSIVKTSHFLDTFRAILETLEIISKGLTCYLEQKRLMFPRFYFLSNDEMLEILSETQDPKRVQPHLKKCFEGIDLLEFTEDLNITAMISSEGERVEFIEQVDTVKANGQVEKWLCDVQSAMKDSVHKSIVDGYKAYSDETRGTWATNWPGQVVLCVSQIKWTESVTKALLRGDDQNTELKLYSKIQEEHLGVVVNFVRSELPPLVRKTMGALIVLDVHSRDVVTDLIEKKVNRINDFNWTSQLRYFWENKNVLVRMIYTEAQYAYEYLGNSDRLVMTPLTDRCYRTLMAAYHLHLNGAPEGPAGTGKTETTKDLAKALAVQCVVFNCSEGLDYLAMGKFFKGLASSGAWACFDEFNRIELEVLSVVAQQIQCITHAIQCKKEKFEFEGTMISLNPTCYVCITMNPHYAGRSQLPDNLKVLFRTVAMMVPDYGMIAEILLYSYGFLAARPLSEKLVVVFRLCSEQLSPQWHYDYGMRALKAVLAVAGQLKLIYVQEPEESLLLKAVIDVNTPKFLSHDIPLFHGILQDLFPNIKQTQTDEELFFETAKDVCHKMNLNPVDGFLEKLSQTYSVMSGRHGFMLVGAPDSGKSTILNVLAKTLSSLPDSGEVLMETLNPKTLNLAQLFGQFDPVSREWSDGLVAQIFRKFANLNTPQRKWIIFDGPVDTLWAESMNTVLDDNKKLCLMSGETICLTSTMSLIFEVTDLAGASPATVSRCGMVYIEPEVLGWRPQFTSWLAKVPERWRLSELLTSLSEWLIPASLEFQRKNCKEWVSTGDQSLVRCLLQFVTMVMEKGSSRSSDASDMRFIRTWVMGAFAFGITWSIGGALDSKSREKFSYFLKELLIGSSREYPVPENIGKFDCPFPIEGLIYDYNFECRGRSQWVPWSESLHPLDDDSVDIREVIVPTVDTVRYSILMDLFIQNKKPLLLVGPTGTGKSVYSRDKLLKGLSNTSYLPIILNFCAHTTAPQIQDIIMSKLEKRRKGVYGPPLGKKCVILVDDLNMPQAEKYGAHPPLELLRQLLDHGYWFDRKELTKIVLQDVQLLAVMGPPGGARSNFTPRLLRHFTVLSVNQFSEETLTRIFNTLMNIHLRAQTFPVDMFSAVGTIVRATLDIYQSTIKYLLPTPSKSHYIFNLRDFARVIHGCCLIKRESVPNRRVFVRLWVHEVMRVYYDRLEDYADRTWVFNMVKDCVKTHFKESFELVFAQQAEFGKVTEESMQNLMFGTYMNPDASLDDRVYEEVTDMKQYEVIVRSALKDYNSIHKTPMNLVIFRYVLEHVSRISRILATPGGHALLVGVGGSGRQSCARLAAFIAGYTVFQPEATKSYSFMDWRDDLKKVLKSSGAYGKHMVLLITESQIREERFLEDIDSLLNSGEIANLYAIDERQEIIEAVQSFVSQQVELSLSELFALFIRRCRVNLHIVIAFSPIGNAFYRRLRHYPSLVNCCTIDWFLPWPTDALEKVANFYVEEVAIPYQVKPAVSQLCRHFHTSVFLLSEKFLVEQNRATYVTASSYLELLGCYRDLLASQQSKLQDARKRYQGGLEKLANAAKQVERMQQELEELQPQLVIAATETEQMIVTIEKESKEAEIKRQKVREDEILANKQADEAQALKDECETDLAEALPALESAVTALDTLKPSDITLVKSMKNPPKAIKIVMAAVCVMKGVKADRITDPSGKKTWDYWGPSKKLLADLSFLAQLKEYDKDNVPNNIMDTIRKEYLTLPEFKPKIVAKASTAAEGLCKWVVAIEFYDKVAKMVAPKRQKLSAAESSLEETMAALATKQEELRLVEEHVKSLQLKFQEMSERKRELEVQVEICSRKLERATKLLDGLAGEKERWSLEAERLAALYANLPGDVLLASGIIAYLGPFNVAYRRECLKDWYQRCVSAKIPSSQDFVIRNILGDPEIIEQWFQQGLPSDSFSVDNAIIVHHSRRWPLLIDPENQANKWIKKSAGTQLKVVKLTDPDFIVNLKMCLQLGIPLLVEGLGEELDPRLDPVLSKQTFKQAGLDMIQLGDFAIEYSPHFRLYMTTKLRNPHYLPETATKVSLLNFTITPDGLEDQLLGIVVSEERPDLEEARSTLIERIASHRRSLKEIEDKILLTLASTQGNLLEDETAIQVLDHSKVLANDVAEKQEVAKQTEMKIRASREKYSPVAIHSSKLFFCLTNLPNVDPMYQYSLSWFIGLYVNSVRSSPKTDNLEERLDLLIDHFTYSLFSSVSRSLLEKHKLLFSFLLCCNLQLGKEVNEEEFRFLLKGGVGIKSGSYANPTTWLSKNNWENFCCLCMIPAFDDIRQNFIENSDSWLTEIPSPWNESLNDFQKLLIYRCIRLNRISYYVRRYVASKMGRRYIEHPIFDIRNSFNDSSCHNPLIFILSPGSDPISAIKHFAEIKDVVLRSVSLGQGQGPITEKNIKEAQKDGSWVVLQNCHLALSWMSSLEKLCENIPENVNPNYRLWLTSYPSDKFPIPILQDGVKITNESPPSLRDNLYRCFSKAYEDKMNQSISKLTFSFCLFHAVVQERCQYGPIGWNVPYTFDESDLQITLMQLKTFLKDSDVVPFQALTYLVGECNYGGRVTDDWDRQRLRIILKDFCNPNVLQIDGYKFSESDLFYLPTSEEDYLSYIKKLPENSGPGILGMHDNVEVQRELMSSQQLLDNLLLTQITTVGNTGLQKEETFLKNMITDLSSKLPNELPSNIDKKIQFGLILQQESERYNGLLKTIKSSLQHLERALEGKELMTTETESLGLSLVMGRVPQLWLNHSYLTKKPLASYITDLTLRVSFFRTWCQSGKTPALFWLPAFFFPQAFLTTGLQYHTREFGSSSLPIDKLAYDFTVMSEMDNFEVTEGFCIDGLFLEGARWDSNTNSLVEQQEGQLWETLPALWLKPTFTEDIDENNRYKCPLYRTSERRGTISTTGHSSNFIMSVYLPTIKSSHHWTKRGTALLCQLDD